MVPSNDVQVRTGKAWKIFSILHGVDQIFRHDFNAVFFYFPTRWYRQCRYGNSNAVAVHNFLIKLTGTLLDIRIQNSRYVNHLPDRWAVQRLLPFRWATPNCDTPAALRRKWIRPLICHSLWISCSPSGNSNNDITISFQKYDISN